MVVIRAVACATISGTELLSIVSVVPGRDGACGSGVAEIGYVTSLVVAMEVVVVVVALVCAVLVDVAVHC